MAFRVPRLQHLQKVGHDGIAVGHEFLLRDLDSNHLDQSAQQTLHSLLLLLVLVRQGGHAERLSETVDDGGEELQQNGLDVGGGILD